MRDPIVRAEPKRAAVWFGLGVGVALVVLLIQPLLVIFGGLVVASMLDGGERLLGRVLPIARGWRLLIVVLLVLGFIGSVFYLTGSRSRCRRSSSAPHWRFRRNRVVEWMLGARADARGAPTSPAWRSRRSARRAVTSRGGPVLGAARACLIVLSIGIFVAIEPRLYERGLHGCCRRRARRLLRDSARMARMLRVLMAGRLVGMVFEGVLTWIMLSIAGVPMALLLGILTGMLAFIPNLGAFIAAC